MDTRAQALPPSGRLHLSAVRFRRRALGFPAHVSANRGGARLDAACAGLRARSRPAEAELRHAGGFRPLHGEERRRCGRAGGIELGACQRAGGGRHPCPLRGSVGQVRCAVSHVGLRDGRGAARHERRESGAERRLSLAGMVARHRRVSA